MLSLLDDAGAQIMTGPTVGVVIAVLVSISGCATPSPKVWAPAGSSRSDGTVTLGFQYATGEDPQIALQDGIPQAGQVCAGWGYTGAQPVGSSRRQCAVSNAYSCFRYAIYADYRCAGGTR